MTFGVIIVWGDLRVVQEGEDGVLVTDEALGKTASMLVGIGSEGDLEQAGFEALLAAFELFEGEGRLPAIQPESVFEEAFEFFTKTPPAPGGMDQIHPEELPEQVSQADLAVERHEFVVGAKKVGDESALEEDSQHALDHRGTTATINDKVDKLFVGKAPEPVSQAGDAPAGFIGMEHRGVSSQEPDLIIEGLEHGGEISPSLEQAGSGEAKMGGDVEELDDFVEGHAQAIMEPGGVEDGLKAQGGPR